MASLEVLSEGELNHIVSMLRTSPLEWVGNEEWTKQMSLLEQLNIQAAYEAQQGGEERVRDTLVEADKMSYFVHELILLELWRKEVLPLLLQHGVPQTSFQVSIDIIILTQYFKHTKTTNHTCTHFSCNFCGMVLPA